MSIKHADRVPSAVVYVPTFRQSVGMHNQQVTLRTIRT
jgi:hypothetical protein